MEWRLFADLAERADTRRVTVDIDPGASVRDALDALLEAEPDLRERVLEDGAVPEHITVLHNGTALTPDELTTPVDDGDELALCPPVSGG
jgi:molybdopterin synthase sulfur carrier subunit